MTDPITTNVVKAPARGGSAPQERKMFMSRDNPAKKMNTTFDPNRYPGVVKRNQKNGLPALQTQDLRIIAERKKTLAALAERKIAQAAAAARKANKAPAKGAKHVAPRAHRKGK
jgi:hypothetical protein